MTATATPSRLRLTDHPPWRRRFGVSFCPTPRVDCSPDVLVSGSHNPIWLQTTPNALVTTAENVREFSAITDTKSAMMTRPTRSFETCGKTSRVANAGQPAPPIASDIGDTVKSHTLRRMRIEADE
jgi:hypothetical protein